jgi:putative membrane-bound dehydrogenase-like protein
LRVAPGFRVWLYADQDLANDIFAMTLDARGRVVVTGPGYIKVLHDTKGAGKADQATLFATPSTGGMGLCFDGNDLYFCGGGWLSGYRDPTGKGVADGPPEHILPLAYGEHGGHAMRKGPDGCWYVIGGNDSKITSRLITARNSPVRAPEAGALLRLSPDCRQREVIAHGFRNPYDFDFNEAGDLFTYDSDCERDFFLPWYTPTRMYHIALGGHHGWRLTGASRSWCRRDDYLDTVDMLWPVGRGSPTGVVCYRHDQFPEHYRGGLFALDWTFGRVYFFPLRPDGSSYRTEPEIFLEATGTNGFDPTDAVVAPDGSLLVCMGGRGTRGAVYRIEYVGHKESDARQQGPASELETVLRAHQPLDAWSRARWAPAARKLGPEPFAGVIVDEKWQPGCRVRAVEIATELFDGLSTSTATTAARAASPSVRSRVAWSLGRRPCAHFEPILLQLSEDSHPDVRRWALEALAERFQELPAEQVADILPPNLGASDKRVRQAAAHLAAMFPQASWAKLSARLANEGPQARITAALANLWRNPAPDSPDAVIETALDVLKDSTDVDLRLQAIRLIMLALGDYHLHNPPVEVYTAYSLQNSLAGHEALAARVLDSVRPLFPSGHARLDEESARLLAMLEDSAPGTPSRVASLWTERSSPTQDLHYLIVFSCLRGARTADISAKVAQTLVSLHRKLEGREQRIKQLWSQRLGECLANLLNRDPLLGDALLQQPGLVDPGNVSIALSLARPQRARVAQLFLTAARRNTDFVGSGPVLQLLEELPVEEVRPLLRAQWSDYALRDDILLSLARAPEAADRDKFLAGLESAQPPVRHACLAALEHLPRDDAPKNLVPPLRLLHRLEQEPKQSKERAQVLALVSRQSAESFSIKEAGTTQTELSTAYQPVFDWFKRRHPSLVETLRPGGGEDVAAYYRLLSTVEWTKGNASRGEALFRSRACQTCHAGSRALGPDLTGVTSRFSRADLFTAIIDPSRDVAPAYRTDVVETRNGQLITGIVTFESADGLIIQTGATTTVRIGTPEIVSRLPSHRSLMPDGLLKDLKAADLADLYSYLQTLKAKPATDNSK